MHAYTSVLNPRMRQIPACSQTPQHPPKVTRRPEGIWDTYFHTSTTACILRHESFYCGHAHSYHSPRVDQALNFRPLASWA